MVESQARIRRANTNDLPILGKYGARLARQHHAYDQQRFTLFEPVEARFARFFEEQLIRQDAAILIADVNGSVVGYTFVRIEPESFLDLLSPAAWIHDIYVDEAARGKWIGAM